MTPYELAKEIMPDVIWKHHKEPFSELAAAEVRPTNKQIKALDIELNKHQVNGYAWAYRQNGELFYIIRMVTL